MLGLAILAGIIFKLRTKDGTLIVEVDQPDAVVQVLNEEGKVEITRPGEKGTVTISVDPGKHRLKVEKDGFIVFGQDFEMESGGTQSIKATLEEDKPWFRAEFKKWEEEVAALPAEDQVKAVSKKLMEWNPGFDGRLGELIEAGVVIAVTPTNDHLIDISPLRAFSKLKTLRLLTGVPQVHPLADLSALTGMQITELAISWTKVTDLRPINKLPLVTLVCMAGELADLSPLAGMALTSLDCSGTKVSDLSPLKGTKLTTLAINGTKVSTLLPLLGLPLKSLACSKTEVSDLSPLKGMALTGLELTGTNVSDLSPLVGMPLSQLQCGDSKVTDLKPLQGMPLTNLLFDGTQVADLSPLRGMPLTFLSLANCSLVTDVAPLDGMRLVYLGLQGTKVTPAGVAALRKTLPEQCDVRWDKPADEGKAWESPAFKKWEKEVAALPAERQIEEVVKKLQELNPGFDGKVTDFEGKPPFIENGVVTRLGFATDNLTDISPVRALTGLSWLDCSGSGLNKGQLSDLSPLKGMPLQYLRFAYTRVSDLSPLQGMRLWLLVCDGTQVTDLSPIQGMHLSNLGIGQTKISDISALKGMTLAFFEFDITLVSDISPLRGMPLNFVYFNQTKVADLSPLSGSGMSLRTVGFSETPVSNLSPLAGMQLTHLIFTPKNITQGIDVVRNMKTIERFGTYGWEQISPADFWKRYDAGEFGKPTAANKPITTYKDPAFKKWEKEVAKLPAEEQVKAVVKKLQELNPGFDGKEKHAFEGGVATELHFVTDRVTDISPVRALAGLKSLSCNGSDIGKGRLSDLSSLRGMQLMALGFENTEVSDLSPLKAMPLTFLWCSYTKVADLSPLKNMKLTMLWFSGTSVIDLSQLHDMPLADLHCENTSVADLAPLNGLKLTQLLFTPKNITNGMDAIRQMNSLQQIGVAWGEENRFSPDAFWRKYDAGEFNK